MGLLVGAIFMLSIIIINMEEEKAKSISNKLKVKAGKDWDNVVQQKLEFLEDEGIIRSSDRNINFKHNSYNYEKQFLANFVIYTNDNKRIIIRSSSSFRGDRVKMGFYDIEGIIKYSNLTDDIVATIYLLPDTELDNTTFISTRTKILNKEYYIPASHLFVLSEFENFLTNYENENRAILEELAKEKKFKNLKEAGSYFGRIGNKLEKEICDLVSTPSYLVQYKAKKKPKFYQIINFIVQKNKIDFNEITKINSSFSIPLLISGGSAKSDIWIELELNQSKVFETFSIKNSTKKQVSVHDYAAERFIEVLDCLDSNLKYYLEHFQDHPSYSEFEETLDIGKSVDEFTNLLNSKKSILGEWVLMGKHDIQNLNLPKYQISNNIVMKTNKDLLIYDSITYLDFLYKNVKLKYGVPFSWTYPSKQRKKRIQLKLPIRKIT